MGKIRIKTLGDEEKEKKQKQDTKARKEAKIVEKKDDAAVIASDEGAKQSRPLTPKRSDGERAQESKADAAKPEEKAPQKKVKKDKFKKKGQTRSNTYLEAVKLVEKGRVYRLTDALSLLPKLKRAKFDESVELHINTIEAGVSGSMTLPHGTGKKMRVVIVNAAKDPKSLDDLVKTIESGKIDFDILIATPDSMQKLAKAAKFLGPRGLMPNPKNGTVTPHPEEVAKKFEGGQINFKTEAKFPIIHLTIGKVSFGDQKLSENIKTALGSIQTTKIKNVTLKSTMSPAIKLDFSVI